MDDFDDDSIVKDENPLIVGRRQGGAIFGPRDVGRRIALPHLANERSVLTDADPPQALDPRDRGRNFDVNDDDRFGRAWAQRSEEEKGGRALEREDRRRNEMRRREKEEERKDKDGEEDKRRKRGKGRGTKEEMKGKRERRKLSSRRKKKALL